MLNGHAHNIPFFINVYVTVFAYLFRLVDDFVCEFYVSSIRALKIFHPHILFLLVRPAEESITFVGLVKNVHRSSDIVFFMRCLFS
jgi:uncharacterized membrane protein